ncbi:MAG: hypothetical protein ACKVH3_05215, partial [Candidatus Pelagibacterales bacterium]
GIPKQSNGAGCKPAGSGLRRCESFSLHHKKLYLSSFFYLSLIVDYLDFSAISTWLLWVKQFGTAGVVQW